MDPDTKEVAKVIPDDKLTKHKLAISLRSLEAVVGHLSRLYLEHPELNDQVDIHKIIPMSLDEWEIEIQKKVDELVNATINQPAESEDDPRKLNPGLYKDFLHTFTDIHGAYEEYQQEFVLTDEQPLTFDQWERREFDMFLSMEGDSYRVEK